jgi:HrpA-like RNA helicase
LEEEINYLLVLPLYSALPKDQQAQSFISNDQQRKCIIATNAAETNVTINGIVYVVDTGKAKASNHMPALLQAQIR